MTVKVLIGKLSHFAKHKSDSQFHSPLFYVIYPPPPPHVKNEAT